MFIGYVAQYSITTRWSQWSSR